MSATPPAADDVMKLLDRGHTVVLYKNSLGSYTALAVADGAVDAADLEDAITDLVEAMDDAAEHDDDLRGVTMTDDFTPARALYRLTEKATTGRIA